MGPKPYMCGSSGTGTPGAPTYPTVRAVAILRQMRRRNSVAWCRDTWNTKRCALAGESARLFKARVVRAAGRRVGRLLHEVQTRDPAGARAQVGPELRGRATAMLDRESGYEQDQRNHDRHQDGDGTRLFVAAQLGAAISGIALRPVAEGRCRCLLPPQQTGPHLLPPVTSDVVTVKDARQHLKTRFPQFELNHARCVARPAGSTHSSGCCVWTSNCAGPAQSGERELNEHAGRV